MIVWGPSNLGAPPDRGARGVLATALAGGMRNLKNIWFSQRIKIATKVRIYQLCIMTILLHCSETWTLTKACCSRLQLFHM